MCKKCRAAKEREARRLRKERHRELPCVVGGCEKSRYEVDSQVVPYCAEHWKTAPQRQVEKLPSDQKRCCRCGVVKLRTEFYGATQRGACKVCQRSEKSDYYHQNPLRARSNRYRNKYGIAPEQFDALVAEQNSVCKICGETAVLVPDHCHKGGGFRGAICGPCNLGLGNFRDNPKFLEAAASYLL